MGTRQCTTPERYILSYAFYEPVVHSDQYFFDIRPKCVIVFRNCLRPV